MTRVALVSSLLAAVLAAAALSSGATGQLSRVIDRTFVCSTLVHAGVRKMDVYATSTVPGQPDYQGRRAFPRTHLITGGIPTSSGGGGPIVGGATLVSAQTGEARESGGAHVVLSDKQCNPSPRRVALSPRGLGGGRASPLGETFECYPPRAILLRTRAVFRSPTRLRRDRWGQLHTGDVPVRQAAFAVTTLSGKPLVYAEVFESGRARLFFAGSCVRD